MKSHIVVAIFVTLLYSSTTFGQTEKGAIYIGARSGLNASFTKSKLADGREAKNRSFNISPTVQYYIINNLGLGLLLPYGYSSTKLGSDKNVTHNFGVTPSITYLFGENQLKPFISAEIGFGRSNITYTILGEPQKQKTSFIEYEAGGGISYFLKERIAMNLGIYYSYSKPLDTNQNKSGIIARLGFLFKLN